MGHKQEKGAKTIKRNYTKEPQMLDLLDKGFKLAI